MPKDLSYGAILISAREITSLEGGCKGKGRRLFRVQEDLDSKSDPKKKKGQRR